MAAKPTLVMPRDRWSLGWVLTATALLLAAALDVVPLCGWPEAADLIASTPSAALIDPRRMELRFGGFAHGVGSVEGITADLNAELVFPRFPIGQGEWWSFLIPRPHVGGLLNLSDRTSYVYGGGLWTVPLSYGCFGEAFFGGAIHNGSLLGDATHAALGCQGLFHVGGSLGYSLTAKWHAMFTFDHVSNGNLIFGTDCARNQGLNNYGVRIGYSF